MAVWLLLGVASYGVAGGVSDVVAIAGGLVSPGALPRLGPTYRFQLEQYQALQQGNPDIYGDPATYEQDKTITCLATVYVMLDRANGKPNAMLDDKYWDPVQGALPPAGYEVQEQPGFDYEAVKKHIKTGNPVILRTDLQFPTKRYQHFVLAVGFEETAEGVRSLVVLDPLSGEITIEDTGKSTGVSPFSGAAYKSRIQAVRYVRT